jgi:hypothetical protein
MTIENGQIANADEVMNAFGMVFKNQSQLLFNSAYIGFDSKLNVDTGIPELKNIKYDIMTSDSATTKTNFTYDASKDLYYIDGSSDGTLIFQTTGLDTITDCIATINYSLDDTFSTYTTQCDFTSATLPSGWVEVEGNHGTATWDSANDEEDISIANNSHYGMKSASLVYDTEIQYGTIKSAFRNIVATLPNALQGSTYRTEMQGSLNWGSNYIRIRQQKSHHTLSNVFIEDSEGGSYDTSSTSMPTQVWFKISKTRNGRIITQYSLTGDSDYTTLTNSLTGASTTYSKPTMTYALGSPTGLSDPTPEGSASIYNFTINSTSSGENPLTVSISADGTNYETVTDATIHRFTNTGTNLYIKFEIDRVDTSAIDKISEYAIIYNIGAS